MGGFLSNTADNDRLDKEHANRTSEQIKADDAKKKNNVYYRHCIDYTY